MGPYLIRRLLAVIPMLFFITIVVFAAIQLIPGDLARIYTGEDARATPEYIEQVRKDLGLDQPVYIQYLRWLGRTLSGDLGTSVMTKRSVTALILEAVPKTVYLSLLTIALAIAVGVPCGIIAAVYRKTKIDFIVTLIATFGAAMPAFWFAILLIFLLSVQLRWLPAFGYADPLTSPIDSLKLMLLPAFTLGLSMCAAVMRQLRSSMLNVLHSDYIRTARAKGLRSSVVLLNHALRNALVPLITIIGVQATVLMSGTVITETIFAIPGLGRLAIQAITAKDYPVLMGCMLVVTIFVLLINLGVDMLYTVVDPRIRYQ